MSQGLSSLVPDLRIDDRAMDPDQEMASTREGSLGRTLSPDVGSSNSQETVDTCCTDLEPTEMGRMDVHVIPASFYRNNSTNGSQMPVYEMFRDKRGHAIIIDIEIYENDVQERRFGSHVDVLNLESLLKQLNFEVVVHKDLPRPQFYKVITEFCANDCHKEADMTIVVILSHGKDDIVYAADGQSINMEDIYEFFNNRNCPNLQGKPKFFIVQACRGDRPDEGVSSGGVSYHTHHQAKKRRASGMAIDGLSGINSGPGVIKARPTWEDMIIAYSTIPGYASLRDHERGTWFIQSLVEVFMNHAHDTELVDLLRMTSERLSHFTNEQGEKQTCNVEMRHLYKRIYFNPGLSCRARMNPALTRSLSTPPASPYNPSAEL